MQNVVVDVHLKNVVGVNLLSDVPEEESFSLFWLDLYVCDESMSARRARSEATI